MTSFIPISLVGDNLGQRHRHLNTLVDQAYQQNEPFQTIQQLPEHSPIDRLFKIDLASKYRHVEYILYNLKDEDMLYVSRALKSYWLLEPQYAEIVNPSYLQETLYPQMITTAVNKMKHFISLNLCDSQRCEEFFEYYIDKTFDLAINFLCHCSDEYKLIKVIDILDKLTPHQLKLLSESCPGVAKVYFETLQSNESVLSSYLNKENEYYDNLKCLLKINADIFLDITEKFFNQYSFKTFSPEATRYIMNNHKKRFNKKPELYTAWLLDTKTLAKHIDPNEIKDVILCLARAQYLNGWFTYKKVEPLIKRLSVENRTALKKQVFVDKSFGHIVEEWPYKPPMSPEGNISSSDIFQDEEHDPQEYENLDEMTFLECARSVKRKKKCTKRRGKCDMYCMIQQQSPLDQLFDRYRFTSFEKTLSELRRKMVVENLQNRQNMMLVLVSKSGGHQESLNQLLKLLIERHENEPVHLRATIVRSLVKRCSAWRLPQTLWDLMLRFGRNLGLDGKPSAASCLEGLHAVVLRNMLLNRDCDSSVWEAFMKNFSPLKEYSLTPAERRIVSIKLPALLLSYAVANPFKALRFNQLLDTLDAYNIRADKYPGVVPAIKAAAHHDSNAECLLHRLFSSGIARKELFKDNFLIIQTGPSYFNALKHDTSVLKSGDKFEMLLESGYLQHERFFRALALYFSEDNGLAEMYLSLLQKRAESMPKNELARPIVLMSGVKLMSLINKLDKSPKNTLPRRLAVALRANAHLSRPLINFDAIGWQSIGAKAVANQVLKCSDVNVEPFIEKLLSWKHTEKLAFVLSMRIGKEYSVFTTIATKRPRLALKTALWHLRRTNTLDSRMWDIIISLVARLDVSGKPYERLRSAIGNIGVVPLSKKSEYCAVVFDVFKKISINTAMPVLSHLELILPDVDGRFIGIAIKDFLDNDFSEDKVSKSEYDFNKRASIYVRIIAKYLLLSKTESIQKYRFENVGRQFLSRLETLWKSVADKNCIIFHIDNFILSLKYTKVYLNTEYVSCLPVIENVINWMQRILPVEIYFDKYVQLHLTMLFFKSIKQGMKNNIKIFEDLPNRINEGVEIVGVTFGKYIAHEIRELQNKYFDSIIDLYKTELVDYLHSYFAYSTSRTLLTAYIIKGILRSESRTHLLAQYVYSEDAYNINECVGDQIKKLLNESQSQEINFFLHADI